MLVLGALGFRDRKETDGTNLFCWSDCETIGILEDEDDDEHEDDSSNSVLGLCGQERQDTPCNSTTIEGKFDDWVRSIHS